MTTEESLLPQYFSTQLDHPRYNSSPCSCSPHFTTTKCSESNFFSHCPPNNNSGNFHQYSSSTFSSPEYMPHSSPPHRPSRPPPLQHPLFPPSGSSSNFPLSPCLIPSHPPSPSPNCSSRNSTSPNSPTSMSSASSSIFFPQYTRCVSPLSQCSSLFPPPSPCHVPHQQTLTNPYPTPAQPFWSNKLDCSLTFTRSETAIPTLKPQQNLTSSTKLTKNQPSRILSLNNLAKGQMFSENSGNIPVENHNWPFPLEVPVCKSIRYSLPANVEKFVFSSLHSNSTQSTIVEIGKYTSNLEITSRSDIRDILLPFIKLSQIIAGGSAGPSGEIARGNDRFSLLRKIPMLLLLLVAILQSLLQLTECVFQIRGSTLRKHFIDFGSYLCDLLVTGFGGYMLTAGFSKLDSLINAIGQLDQTGNTNCIEAIQPPCKVPWKMVTIAILAADLAIVFCTTVVIIATGNLTGLPNMSTSVQIAYHLCDFLSSEIFFLLWSLLLAITTVLNLLTNRLVDLIQRNDDSVDSTNPSELQIQRRQELYLKFSSLCKISNLINEQFLPELRIFHAANLFFYAYAISCLLENDTKPLMVYVTSVYVILKSEVILFLAQSIAEKNTVFRNWIRRWACFGDKIVILGKELNANLLLSEFQEKPLGIGRGYLLVNEVFHIKFVFLAVSLALFLADEANKQGGTIPPE